jgi:hypothetical protein
MSTSRFRGLFSVFCIIPISATTYMDMAGTIFFDYWVFAYSVLLSGGTFGLQGRLLRGFRRCSILFFLYNDGFNGVIPGRYEVVMNQKGHAR